MKYFLNNSDEHLGGHGAPDLHRERILADAHKFLDGQVIFEQLEEQYYLPVAFVQSWNGKGWPGRVVGYEDQSLFVCWVLEPDTAHVFGIFLENVVSFPSNGLNAVKTATSAYLCRVHEPVVHFAFGAGQSKKAPD